MPPTPPPEGRERPGILLVDDERALLQVTTMLLSTWGYDVHACEDAESAIRILGERSFDCVLSDIGLPGADGLDVLKAVRSRDLDVPVILMTGGPTVETAMRAVELGAFRYLRKPVVPEELKKVAEHAVRLHRMAIFRRQAADLVGDGRGLVGDLAGLQASFERALDGLWMAFQPIVTPGSRTVFGYEALVRTKEPTLPHPGALFDAAERLGRLHELGRTIRTKVAASLRPQCDKRQLVNLHPQDLLDDDLFDPAAPLSRVAERVVLELTERAALERIADVRGRVSSLRRLGYCIAVDDLGSGYAGLNSFALLEPEVVKLDMVLVRGVDALPTKQKVIASMIGLCRELGMDVICEGVETAAERETLSALGCALQQGYLFARPGPDFPDPNWGL